MDKNKTMHHKATIGDITYSIFLDGAEIISTERFLRRYPQATEADYRDAFAQIGQSLETADSSFNILLAHVDRDIVLVDAGEGGKPAGGELIAQMHHAHISPESVTLIILTHSHGDHVMGLLTNAGKPTFPNARYVLSAKEYAYWQAKIDAGLDAHRPILEMMHKQGLRLIATNEVIINGVTAVPMPGHTPGQIGVLFESKGERLLHMADLLHSPIQFAHPEWSAKFDADISISVPTRQHLLTHVADAQLLTLFYHLTFPGLGYVTQTKTGFTWNPV